MKTMLVHIASDVMQTRHTLLVNAVSKAASSNQMLLWRQPDTALVAATVGWWSIHAANNTAVDHAHRTSFV